jgi:hypothetical protein
MSYLFIKNQFQREKFVLFSLKILKFKKNPKNIFSGFFSWVFLGFFRWVFYCQPCAQGTRVLPALWLSCIWLRAQPEVLAGMNSLLLSILYRFIDTPPSEKDYKYCMRIAQHGLSQWYLKTKNC